MKKFVLVLVLFLVVRAVPALGDSVPLLKGLLVHAPATPAEEAFQRGVTQIADGRYVEADRAFRESIKLDAAQGVAYVGLADLAFRKKQYKEAEGYYRHALQNDPGHAGIQESWGRFLFEIQRYKEAEAAFRKSLEINKVNGPLYMALGDTLLRGLNQPAQAAAAYREGLRLNPEHGGGHFGLGMALERQGEWNLAKSEFETSAQLSPQNPMPYQALGELLIVRKDTEGALRAFQMALERDPKYYFARLSCGDIYLERKDYTRALSEYDQVSQAQPKLALPKIKSASCYQVQGRLAEAKKLYLEAVAIDTKSAIAYNNLAWMAADSRTDLDKALPWAEKAVSLAPKDISCLDTLGWVYHAKGMDSEALKILTTVIQKSPSNPSMLYHFGVIAEQLGKMDDAKQAYAKALKIDPSFPEAADARKRLARFSA